MVDYLRLCVDMDGYQCIIVAIQTTLKGNIMRTTYKLSSSALEKKAQYPEFWKKWIEGLRSNRYTQCKWAMADSNDECSACCLAVAEMHVNGRTFNEMFRSSGVAHKTPLSLEGGTDWTTHLNILSRVEGEEEAYMRNPEYLNDKCGLSFLQIADLLEKGTLTVEDSQDDE